MKLSPKLQGYLFVFITMFIWGSFSLMSRLNAHWHISAWDITAIRFSLAFVILFPILLYKRDTAFLWRKETVVLALVGGVGYSIIVYSAFIHSSAAHGAIFLNGNIPLFTALMAWIILKQPFDKHIWISLVIMVCSIALMTYLMGFEQHQSFNIGDVLFVLCALFWGIFSVLLRRSLLTAWQAMSGVAIWSALIYVPIYLLFLPKNIAHNAPIHLMLQGLFHGVFVVIVATLTYVEAIKRLGAFTAGSITTLAPFIAAVLAVPLLHEPLNIAIVCGLIGMGIGALQPWRWLKLMIK